MEVGGGRGVMVMKPRSRNEIYFQREWKWFQLNFKNDVLFDSLDGYEIGHRTVGRRQRHPFKHIGARIDYTPLLLT